MKQLLAIEYAKLKKLTSIKIIFLCYIAVVPLFMYGFDAFLNLNKEIRPLITNNNLFSFPYVWKFTTYAASFFNVLMGVIVVIITCNELQFKTMRQNVIDGLSKTQVILSKLIVVVALSLLVTLTTFLMALLFGVIYSGFDHAFEGVHRIFFYLLQTLGYFSFAFLFAILIRKPALSIVLFIVYFPVETIVGIFIPNGGYQVFPLKVLADLTPIPFFDQFVAMNEKQTGADIWILGTEWKVVLSLGYIVFFFLLSYFLLKKRDL